MFVKLMKDDGLADNDYRKSYTMIEVVSAEFVMCEIDDNIPSTGWCVRYYTKCGKCDTVAVHANVYLLSETGKTIDSFSPNSR